MTPAPLPPRTWPVALAGVWAVAFGLGLARTLFEWQSVRLDWLGGWPGTLLVVAVAATLGVALAWRWPGLAGWQGLPLALPLVHALAPDVDLLRGWTLLLGALALAALLAWRPAALPAARAHPRAERALLAALFAILLLLYLRTLAPAVGEADTFEFQVGIARLGIAHGSGYPLLMLVGKVFSLLPLGGTLAWRTNLTSAFFGALAAVLAARLARRLGAGPAPALLAGLSFGVSPTLWSRAVEVEAYTLNAALVAGLLLLAVDMAASRSARHLPLLALLFGLSLTNHLTTVLLAPACLVAVALALWSAFASNRSMNPVSPTTLALAGSRDPARYAARPFPWSQKQWTWRIPHSAARRLLLAAVGLALGLSVYLYLPLRWPAVNGGQPLSLAQFANILSGNEAKGAFQWDLPLRDPGRYAIVFDKIQGEYGWLGVAALAYGLGLAAHGAWRALRPATTARVPGPGAPGPRDRRAAAYPWLPLALAYAAYVYFALAFNVPDPDFSAFFIPLHLIAAVLIGLGVQSLLALAVIPITRRHAALPGVGRPPLLAILVLTAVALVPLASLWRTLPRVDQSNDWAAYRLGEHILQQSLAPGATILADSQKIAPLYYLQVAEGVRPDLDIVVLPDEASYRAALDERLAAGRTVYLGRYLPGLGGAYALRSVGPLAEVRPAAWTEPPLPLKPARQQPAVPGLRLLGYASDLDGAGLTAAAPHPLPLTLAWQVQAPLDASLLVSLQLVTPEGGVAWRGLGRVPVGGLYPTNAWPAGAVVSDYHAVPIPHTLAPGPYRLQVGLFPPFAVTDTGWTDVGTLTITAPAEPAEPSRRLRARLGGQWLLGYDLPETAPPGSAVDLTLYWLRSTAPAQTVTALGETRSIRAWAPGSLAAQAYVLPAPAEGDSLAVTVDAENEQARCGWLARPQGGCALPPVRLAGQAASADARIFDNQLLLNRATLETPTAAPGGQVQVTLEWQGLRRMTDAYTVFVHLLGPDGLVHGQVDAWPVSGTQATSTWTPGQPVRDPYTLQVPPDAPPGAYQVEIGLYLLSTGQRLPVLNAAGEVVDDRVLLDGLTISVP